MKKLKHIHIVIDEESLKKFEEKIEEYNKNICQKVTKSTLVRSFIDNFIKENE